MQLADMSMEKQAAVQKYQTAANELETARHHMKQLEQ